MLNPGAFNSDPKFEHQMSKWFPKIIDPSKEKTFEATDYQTGDRNYLLL